GVPGHIRRRRRIEDLQSRLLGAIAAADAPVAAAASPEVTADLALLNDLIARHNRYYPIEANLPIDVRTRRLIDRGAPWRPPRPTLWSKGHGQAWKRLASALWRRDVARRWPGLPAPPVARRLLKVRQKERSWTKLISRS